MTGSFSFSSQANYSPVGAVATYTATSEINTISEVFYCESVDNTRNSQISGTFQEPDFLLKLFKVNKQNGEELFVSRAGGITDKDPVADLVSNFPVSLKHL